MTANTERQELVRLATDEAAGLPGGIGEIHAAMTVRKVDSTGPTAFGSPTAGPVGRIVERRVWLHAMPLRPPPLPVERLAHRVAVVATGGPNSDVNALGFREHVHESYQGHRHIPGRGPYPIQDRFFVRSFGVPGPVAPHLNGRPPSEGGIYMPRAPR